MAITKSSFKMQYGGKPSDYEIWYEFNGKSSPSLTKIREYAIQQAKKDKFNISIFGYPNVTQVIDARLFYKYKAKGSDIVYRQQSGTTKYVGSVSVKRNQYFWIASNKKENRVLNDKGEVVRKITKSDWDEYHIR